LQTSKLILDFEFDQHLESHKHVISIIMRFRDTGCYTYPIIFPAVMLANKMGQWSENIDILSRLVCLFWPKPP
jgi:hypothetical protein